MSAASPRRPLSVPLLFAPVFVAVYLLHLTLLRLPYFWDEAGYYIPAAWDFYRLGTLIPESTLRNAHPPLPSILLAAWWKLMGFHVLSTRILMCLVTTVALLAVFRIARTFLGDAAGLTVMLLTAIYPVWFAQSTLAHADMFAAAFSLWAIAFYISAQRWDTPPATATPQPFPVPEAISASLLFALAALAKETAIILPTALFLLEAWLLLSGVRSRNSRNLSRSEAKGSALQLRGSHSAQHVPWLAAFAFPALPLAGWYLYHRAKTGFMFGNPEFLQYNATSNLSPPRIALSLWHRMIHLTVHMNLYLPVFVACAILLLPTRGSRPFLPREAVRMFLVLITAQWLAFSILGGALLTRYLLPAYPLVLLLCVAAWKSRTQWWPAIATLSLAAFAIGCEVAPPYPFAPEDNLSYRDMIAVHQDAIRELRHRYPGSTVLTAWPVSADLQLPELGYTHTPMRTFRIDNFSAGEIALAAANAGAYDTALVFSTKYDPPRNGLSLPRSRGNDQRFYGYHRDLLPDEIARALGGNVVWQEERKGTWAAVLYFPRGYGVRPTMPPPARGSGTPGKL